MRSLAILGLCLGLAPATALAQAALPDDLVDRLELLETLKARGLVSDEEYSRRRQSLLDAIAPAAADPQSTDQKRTPIGTGPDLDGTWSGIGQFLVNEEGRCPNVDITLEVKGRRVDGFLQGALIGHQDLTGTLSESGQLAVRTTYGTYNFTMQGTLDRGEWEFLFCSGSYELARQ